MSLETFYRHLDMLLPSAEVLSVKTHDPTSDQDGKGAGILQEIIRRYGRCK
jgi:hypothetical protein